MLEKYFVQLKYFWRQIILKVLFENLHVGLEHLGKTFRLFRLAAKFNFASSKLFQDQHFDLLAQLIISHWLRPIDMNS